MEDNLDKINKMLENHEQRIKKIEDLLCKDGPKSIKKEISVKEFLLSKMPKEDVQKTLVICYYFEKYDGLSSFNAKDIEDGFRRSKEKVPKNINDKVNKNIKNGHIMDAKEKKDKLKAWTLTSSGERFVENGFKEE